MRLRFLGLSVAVLSLFVVQPARAGFEVCNKTEAPFSLAIAYETDSDVVSQGWWTIDPGKCETVINTPLTRPYVYHYVVSRALNVEWAGNINFCVNDDPQFRITGGSECEQRNFRTLGFRETDVGTNKDYALDVSMGPLPEPVGETAAKVQPEVAAPPPVSAPVPAAPQTAPQTAPVAPPPAGQ